MKVTELNVYPVKSCAGISVATAACNDMGLLYDRYFMVVHATSKRMLTQRQLPRMALITVEIDPSILDGTRTGTDASLVMRAPDVSPLTVPLHPPADLQPEALTTCQVWSWKGPAYDMGDEASAWLTHVLGKPTRLFRCLGDHPKAAALGGVRNTDEAWAPGATTGFADEFPLLLTNTASLADLNTKAGDDTNGTPPSAIPMNRFRSNVVVEGAAPWEEDTWKVLRVGDVAFENVKPCGRCTVPAVDQATGQSEGSGSGTLRALQQLRKGETLGEGWQVEALKKEVFFGVNMVPLSGGGLVRVGDVLTVQEHRTSWK